MTAITVRELKQHRRRARAELLENARAALGALASDELAEVAERLLQLGGFGPASPVGQPVARSLELWRNTNDAVEDVENEEVTE